MFSMGNDVTEEVLETVTIAQSFKIHGLMCTELMKLVARISRVIPKIEAARPGSSTGIQALCSLNLAIDKAKLLLQYCSESTKLYLAVTGDAILSRCQRLSNLLEQNLRQSQDTVPVLLAVEISQIADDLRDATFILDSSEEEAGKAMRQLLKEGTCTSNSLETSEITALRLAASKLHITSPKAILIEKRSIRKLLEKVRESNSPKKQILVYLLYLLKTYGHLIMGERTENTCEVDKGSYNQFVEVESHIKHRNPPPQPEILKSSVPPEEFKCPISSKLMYDPVIIASGQTYERVWIKKWFDEGNDTCPRTKIKLAHLSMTPNMVLKDLMSRWCEMHGVTIIDPSIQTGPLYSWENSSSSIASLGSSMNDIHLHMDFSNVSLGSIDGGYVSDLSHPKNANVFTLVSRQSNCDTQICQSEENVLEKDLEFPVNFGELQWETQCKIIEDKEKCLKENCQISPNLSKNFIDQVARFLRDACERHDPKALREGSVLLLALASRNRRGMMIIKEDTFKLLADLLRSEVTKEVLATLEILSSHQNWRSKFTESSALTSILEILDSQYEDFQEKAIRILYNLSSNNDICSQLVCSGCIQRLLPFFNNPDLSGNCIFILKNLCDTREGSISITKTKECIAFMAQTLEVGSLEDQEHAVSILLSLCSQKVQYCHLVMDEGVVPSLVSISAKGSEKGKAGALELLRLLRYIDFDQQNEKKSYGSELVETKEFRNHVDVKKPSNGSAFFGRKISIFSKSSSHGRKKKK